MALVRNNSGSVYPELVLHCVLRYLASGSYLDIVEHIGISYQYFYTVLHKGLNAIQQCDQLKIKFPLQLSEYQQAARDFKSLSTDGIMSGCVAALDGWLCAIKVPSKDEIDDVSSTYSGHYAVNRLNIQAYKLRVMPVAVLF